MKQTCGIFLILSALLFSGADARDGAESVEQRQMNELKKYYYGSQSSEAPKIPMAVTFYNDAVGYFEKGEYAIAREAALESVKLDARNPFAWELLGEIENLSQNFDKAEEYYKKSFALNASPSVKTKLEKLSKERLIEGKMSTYDEEHFVIKYDRDDPRYEGFFLKEMLRDIYRTVSQDLGFYINNKIVVIFYKADDFQYITEQPHFVGGVYDGKIRLPAYRQGFSKQDLRATAAHEMTHAFVAYLSGMKAPAWIQEGLAQYEESRFRPVPTNIIRNALKTQEIIPVEPFMLQSVDTGKNPKTIALFYQQAYSFVQFLVKRFGMYRMKEILMELRKGTDSLSSVEDVLKISPKRLEQEWLISIR